MPSSHCGMSYSRHTGSYARWMLAGGKRNERCKHVDGGCSRSNIKSGDGSVKNTVAPIPCFLTDFRVVMKKNVW